MALGIDDRFDDNPLRTEEFKAPPILETVISCCQCGEIFCPDGRLQCPCCHSPVIKRGC